MSHSHILLSTHNLIFKEDQHIYGIVEKNRGEELAYCWRSGSRTSSAFPWVRHCWALCGRTARNSVLTEALVFHQTLSTPKASYNERCPSGTPRGRTRKIHIFSKDPIMRTSYNTSPFHTSEILEKYIITLPNVRVRNDNQRNLNKHLAIGARIPSEPNRRILHTKVLLMYYLQRG